MITWSIHSCMVRWAYSNNCMLMGLDDYIIALALAVDLGQKNKPNSFGLSPFCIVAPSIIITSLQFKWHSRKKPYCCHSCDSLLLSVPLASLLNAKISSKAQKSL